MSGWVQGVLSVSDLMLGTQAPGAQVEAFCLTINIYGSGMDIGYPAAVGAALGVTDIMAELWCFPA